MLVPPQISLTDFNITPEVIDEKNAPFDYVVVFNFDLTDSSVSAIYSGSNLLDRLDNISLVGLESQALNSIFVLEEEDNLVTFFRKIVDNPHRGTFSVQLGITYNGKVTPVYGSFSLLPTPANGNNTGLSILGVFRDLSKPSAEKLLVDTSTVSNSISLGHDLGKLCYQVCKQLEVNLGEGYHCSLAVSSPSGSLAPVILGGLPYELINDLASEFQSILDSPNFHIASAYDWSIECSSQLQLLGIENVWLAPIIGDGLPGGERIGNGYLFDLGNLNTFDFDLTGMLVVTTSSLNGPDQSQADLIEYAQALLGTAISQAYKISIESFERSHDILTSLPNREYVLDQLKEIMAGCDSTTSNVCVLLVDIDKFQSINHSLGPDTGDLILKEIADRLLASVRLGDRVGRIASDQYLMVCLTQKGELDPKAVATRVLDSVNSPIQLVDESEISVTASIGITVIEDMSISPVSVLGQVESALKEASRKGRGYFSLYDESQQRGMNEQFILESAIQHALKYDEFRIEYQPLVDLNTSKMMGAEALIRWDRPGVGLVNPADFIQVAEESGQIVAIGSWVIDRVCEDLASWGNSEAERPLITINLSAKQLESDLLIPEIISALRRHNLHPSCLGFEITESMRISNIDESLRTLERLKELNCRIAIDDFGIGYATLDYLRRYSMADALKIDRSFIVTMDKSKENRAIVSASIALARTLEMQVVAEGVENSKQVKELRELGCEYAQGYGFSKSVDIVQAKELWSSPELTIA